MIHKIVSELLLEEEDKLFIPAEKVAIIQDDHTLEHALLVLSNVKYSVIPVVNKHSKLVGLISIPMIINKIMDINAINFNQLRKYKVSEVMATKIPTVGPQTDLEDILNDLIDATFLCIVTPENDFLGIITRKEVLKRINYLVHQLEKDYDITAKIPQELLQD
ncbi:cyclic-di-AMP-binding protein CbpB [Granulicatella seriolae]|uniref:CBS domain-containing protein n=1 Tax=Granulicatella seriolae TaxID=2967226 RepID=A0ABT1WP91_9LACT|nr:cyclic-di-AMP-binding protein CbpB [Granulicatella seriolae]